MVIPTYSYIWASKALSNFAGTASRMKQMGLWKDDSYRCCLVQKKDDTTYILKYTHEKIRSRRNKLFNKAYKKIQLLDRNTTTLQLILNSLFEQEESVSRDLENVVNEVNWIRTRII